MPRVKVRITVRQIETADDVLRKKLQKLQAKFERSDPRPDYGTEEAWRKLHPGPTAKWKDRIERAMDKHRKAAEGIMIKARMEMISEDELFRLVEEF